MSDNLKGFIAFINAWDLKVCFATSHPSRLQELKGHDSFSIG